MQATIGGRAISYLVEGQGTPLLLMHAFPLNRTMFDAQVREVIVDKMREWLRWVHARSWVALSAGPRGARILPMVQ